MTVKIASRLDPIKPSITLAVTAKAARLRAEGVDGDEDGLEHGDALP